MKRNEKMKKTGLKIATITLLILFLVGCSGNSRIYSYGEMTAKWNGRIVTIRTFDEQAQIIDKVSGQAVKIDNDKTFTHYDEEGKEQRGNVLDITIGKSKMNHVGSSLIASEEGLGELQASEENQKLDIQNTDKGIPWLESIKASINNNFAGREKLLLIRSQNGTPLAVYGGDSVSMFAPKEIGKSTVFIIDGKYLFVYRCDYTLYDMDLLE